jgi:hypothetical protein
VARNTPLGFNRHFSAGKIEFPAVLVTTGETVYVENKRTLSDGSTILVDDADTGETYRCVKLGQVEPFEEEDGA